jgi:competence protein ComEC
MLPQPLEFRGMPVLAAAVWFALGVVLARHSQPTVVLVIALALLFGLTMVALRFGLRVAVVPVAGIWIAVGMWCAQMEPAPSRQAALLRYADGLSRDVRGRVVRVRVLSPRSLEAGPDQDSDNTQWHEAEPAAAQAMSVDVEVQAVEEVTPDISRMVPVDGGVRVTLTTQSGALPELHCGEIIEAPMQLRAPLRYNDPGAWQYADYLLEQGIGVHANVRAAKLHKIADGTTGAQCRIFAAQSWGAGRLDGYVHSAANRMLPRGLRLSAEDAAMLKAMIFGDRTSLSQQQRIGFQRTGSFHLFVVSGLHVTLLAGAVFWMGRRLRLHEWMTTLLTLALTMGYALLTGFGAPVQRALWMTSIFLVARLLGRDRSVLNALGASALGVLLWSPRSLFEASFQMTFLAVMAIGGIAMPLGARSFLPYARATRRIRDVWIEMVVPPRVAEFRIMVRLWSEMLAGAFGGWIYPIPALLMRWLLWMAELALVGLVVEMVMVLPMAVYFHRATPFALPANMISVPMVALLAPMGVATFVGSLLSNWVALAPAVLTGLLLHGVTWTVGVMSRLPVSEIRVPPPAGWVRAIAVLVWAFCLWAVRRRENVWGWAVVAALPIVAVMILWPEQPLVSAGAMEVTAIDVGQGDSLLVAGPEGRTMLVDAGGPVGGVKETAEAQAAFDIGEEIVSPYLWARRIRKLDVLVLSHAHSDHMGGMAAVMRNFQPRELWVGVDANSEAYRALLEEAAELGVVVRHLRNGDEVGWDGVEVKALSPATNYVNAGEPKNDDSLVLRLEFGKSSVLLEGDAEASSERAMVESGEMQPVTLLKVGHHGSRTSTTQDFFAAAQPRDAVVSVGRNNTFGHPRFEVIDRIAEGHARLYRTDEFGLTTFLLDKDGGIREIVGTANDPGGW